MIRFISSLRERWRWQVRRRPVHIRGITEFRKVGTAAEFVRGRWRIDDDDGRPVYVQAEDRSATGIQIGDLVEVEPLSPSTVASPLAHKYWIIVRRLKRSQA